MNESEKKIYSDWVAKFSDLPIFLEPWWIESVTSGKWDVVFSKRKDGTIKAAWPLFILKRWGKCIIKMPKQTQYLGPWLEYPDGLNRQNRIISYENEVYNDLIKQLPKNVYFKQRVSYTMKNWLAFYWGKFNCQPLYTYRLNLIKPLVEIYQGFEPNIKQDISKAEKILSILEIDDIDLFYDINKMSFARQKKRMPYSLDFARRIDKQLSERGRRRITIAIDEKQRIHSAIYIIIDNNCAYYLWGGSNPDLRNSGANSLLLWDSIKFAKERAIYFDFEGSMIRGVEKFVRAFGGEQTQYFEIYQSHWLIELAKKIKGAFK